MSKLISIVVPTYNQANFLKRAIDSVIKQTHSAWEMIVIDNHSEDDTDQVVHSFRDSRIRLIKINNHGVIAASRNMGIRSSKGEWIAFLDSDDIWYPNRLKVFCENLLISDEIDVWSSDELYVDTYRNIRRQLKYGPYMSPFYNHLLKDGNCLSPSATIVRKQFIFDQNVFFRENIEFITAEDYDFWLNLAQAGARFRFIRQILGDFTIHEKNNSKRLELHKINTMNVVHDHIFNIQKFDENKSKLWNIISIRRQFIEGLVSLKNGELRIGIKKLAESINASPISCVQEIFWLVQKSLFQVGFK